MLSLHKVDLMDRKKIMKKIETLDDLIEEARTMTQTKNYYLTFVKNIAKMKKSTEE